MSSLYKGDENIQVRCDSLEESKRSHLWKPKTSCNCTHRFSEPTSSSHLGELSVQSDEKSASSRNRLPNISSFTAKAESIDIPDDGQATEDSVFPENWQDVGRARMLHHQRSLSVPAKLPDVVQEASCQPDESSPDILSKSGAPYNFLKCWCGHTRNVSVLKVNNEGKEQDVGTESNTTKVPKGSIGSSVANGNETKRLFEGQVHYERFFNAATTGRRKKSVTFEDLSTADLKNLISPEGRERRNHFRSSGYGSLSDGSRTSQASTHSTISDQESVILEEPLERQISLMNLPEMTKLDDDDDESSNDGQFETPDIACTSMIVDGSIHSSDEVDKFCLEACHKDPIVSIQREANEAQCLGQCTYKKESETQSVLYQGADVSVTPRTPDFSSTTEIPDQSIVMAQNSAGRGRGCMACTTKQDDDEYLSAASSADDFEFTYLPFSQKCPSQETVGLFTVKRSIPAEGLCQTKFSPKTNEEFQREFFQRIFMERMQNFDPAKEDIVDVLEWLKNNMQEALSPSPRSPFFPTEGSPQTLKQMVPPDVLNALGITCPPAADAKTLVTKSAQGGHILPSSQPHHPAANSRIDEQGSQAETLSESFVILNPEVQHPSSTTTQAAKQQTLPAVVTEYVNQHNSIFYSENYPSGSSFGTGVGSSYMECIISSSQCCEKNCDDLTCSELRKSINNLKEAIKIGHKLSKENEMVLKLLYQHYNECDLPSCRVAWCRLISRWCKQRRKSAKEVILSSLIKPFHAFNSFIPPWVEFSRKFLKLDISLPWDRMPQEGQDWFVQYLLSQTHSVVRASLLSSGAASSCQDWVLKMVSANSRLSLPEAWMTGLRETVFTMLHDSNNQIEVLESLRELQNSDSVKVIANHLWAAADRGNDLLLVCTEYISGITLKEYLSQRSRLRCQKAAYFFFQILSATEYLHEKNIVYLCWDSSNFIIERRSHLIKMTNLTSSACLLGKDADIGAIKLSLPADIIPPELFVVGGDLEFGSDSWGMGCLLHEMLTGFRPWYSLRHCNSQVTGLEILKQLSSLSLNVPNHAERLLKGCWERSPKQRPLLKEMRLYMKSYFENCQNGC